MVAGRIPLDQFPDIDLAVTRAQGVCLDAQAMLPSLHIELATILGEGGLAIKDLLEGATKALAPTGATGCALAAQQGMTRTTDNLPAIDAEGLGVGLVDDQDAF